MSADALERVFDDARRASQALRPEGSRQVIVLTPGKMMMIVPTPPPGSMPQAAVDSLSTIVSTDKQLSIAVIAHTAVPALAANPVMAIPFLGMLVGLCYIGNDVIVFEGHESSIPIACKNADVVIVDSAIIPLMVPDWLEKVRAVMNTANEDKEVYIHDRQRFKLVEVEEFLSLIHI